MNYDIDFQVPFRHRVRFTDDLVGSESDVLADLISSEASVVAKVLVIADSAISEIATRDGQTNWLDQLVLQLSSVSGIDLLDCRDAGHLVGNQEMYRKQIALVEGGEACKNDPIHVERILGMINHFDIDRRSYVVVIGGGAVLDTVGYAAAVAHRGVRLIRIPTTTLAQDDSGVGVKNAINKFRKKNWVGSFAVPWGVINDSYVLESLPDRDFRCGFSEAVKVSLLKSKLDFDFLCENARAIYNRDMPIAFDAIKRSCVWHLRHITQGGDPFEALEARPLDFGHWSAHKMESMTNYEVRHGEAVGMGVAIDCMYSQRMFGFSEDASHRVVDCLQTLGLPLWHSVLDNADELLLGLEEFRQHLGGRLTVTMLKDVGEPIDVHKIDTSEMRLAIEALRRQVQVVNK